MTSVLIFLLATYYGFSWWKSQRADAMLVRWLNDCSGPPNPNSRIGSIVNCPEYSDTAGSQLPVHFLRLLRTSSFRDSKKRFHAFSSGAVSRFFSGAISP